MKKRKWWNNRICSHSSRWCRDECRDGFWEETLTRRFLWLQASNVVGYYFPCSSCGICCLSWRLHRLPSYIIFQKRKWKEAFTKTAVANGGQLKLMEYVSSTTVAGRTSAETGSSKSYGMLSLNTQKEDLLSITFYVVLFGYDFIGNGNRYGNQGHNGWLAGNGNTESSDSRKEQYETGESVVRKYSLQETAGRWKLKLVRHFQQRICVL